MSTDYELTSTIRLDDFLAKLPPTISVEPYKPFRDSGAPNHGWDPDGRIRWVVDRGPLKGQEITQVLLRGTEQAPNRAYLHVHASRDAVLWLRRWGQNEVEWMFVEMLKFGTIEGATEELGLTLTEKGFRYI